MKTKNKLEKIIDNNLSCNLNYDKLSDKINFDQYLSVEKNKSKRILKPILICVIITIVITLGCSLLFIPSTKYIRNDIMIYYSDKEFVDTFDYIFIAKINKEVKTKNCVNTGTPVPYTFYSYYIIKKIKGEDIDNNNFIVFCMVYYCFNMVRNTKTICFSRLSHNVTNINFLCFCIIYCFCYIFYQKIWDYTCV